jgi:YVTN family beta-propeller protein
MNAEGPPRFHRAFRSALCAALTFGLSVAGTWSSPDRSCTVAVTDDGSRLVVANADSASVSIMDVASRTRIAEIFIDAPVQTVTTRGSEAFIACADGRVATLDLDNLRISALAFGGVELFGVVADGDRLFLSDHGASSIRVVDARTLRAIRSIPTEEYPRGLALDRDARRIYVTHFRSGRISVIDTESLNVVQVLSTGVDSNLSQSITLHAGRAYLPQTRSNASNPALLFDTTVFPTVSVVDLGTGENLSRDRLSIDIVDQPANMPFDAVITSSGKLYVAHAGSDDVSVIGIVERKKIAHLSVGSNPRGVALSPDERFVYVHNALSGTVSVIDTATDQVTNTMPVTSIPLAPDVLNGKILFHTSALATLAKDRWISCATCHFEGGTDGRTWFFRDGPRNTPALFGVASTLPMHWSGDLDELQDVESTIRTVQAGRGLAEGPSHCEPVCDQGPPNAGRSKDLDDLAAFMASLRAPRRTTTRSEAGRRGEVLFADPQIGCASCHFPPLYTDRRRHDVGTAGAQERKGSSFDTPSLRGLSDTPPYFHDGSAATLLEVLARHFSNNLTPDQKNDLVEFLRSLPFPSTPSRQQPCDARIRCAAPFPRDAGR